MGRKNKYESHVAPRLGEITEMIRTMTEAQVAETLGISAKSFERYKETHEELREALKKGRQSTSQELRSILLERARGFYRKETEIIVLEKNGRKQKRIKEVERYFPPDVGAAHLLLKNIDPNWHNDDQATLDLKAARLEIEKLKAEQNIFE